MDRFEARPPVRLQDDFTKLLTDLEQKRNSSERLPSAGNAN
jgi:hypothetical protein